MLPIIVGIITQSVMPVMHSGRIRILRPTYSDEVRDTEKSETKGSI
jgi:hypothetical protein